MRWRLLLALIVLLTAARVMTTHRVFSQTADEPFHVASGYDALTKRSFSLDPEHPPLARVLFGLPFINTPDPGPTDPIARGNALLFRNDRYTQNLGVARLGNLVFLALGIIAVALWARHLVSPVAGLLAALLYASLPPVLAHASVSTTDMAGAAMITLALYATTLFVEQPSWKRTVILGLAVAGGLLAKFSFIVYFPLAALIVAVARRRLPFFRVLVAALLAFVVVWGVYGFQASTLQAVDARAEKMSVDSFGTPRIATRIPFPAPQYVFGILVVKNHDHYGHPAILFGEKQWRGWWYYFPVALFFKTPIPFLILALAGCALMLARRRFDVPLIALSILGVAMTSHLNIGVRHVLPIYAPLAVAAAFAVVSLPRLRVASAALVAWLVISVAAAHPDYLPWFNFAAGRHPETVLSDSNVDWGQDVLRLVRTARRMKIQKIKVSLFTTADLDRVGLPPYEIMHVLTPVQGWLAISEMNVAHGLAYSPEVRKWLEDLLRGREYQRVGRTIRLYYIP